MTPRVAGAPKRSPSVGTADLTKWDVTALLLASRRRYRHRAVDEVVLQTEGLYRLNRSIQLDPLRSLLEEGGYAVAEGEQPVVLPLSTMPKAALLEFDVEGPNGEPAYFVSRKDTANRQVDLVRELAALGGVPMPPRLAGLLYGIGLFTPGMLDGAKTAHGDDRQAQLVYALTTAYDRRFDPAKVAGWSSATEPAGELLAGALSAPRQEESSSENPLLALIDTSEDKLTDAEITDLLDEYAAWVQALAASEDELATDALKWLAVFGRRYIALVDTVIDPDRPALLKMSERRELPLEKGVGWSARGLPAWRWIPASLRQFEVETPSRRWRCQVDLEMKEARSYHLRVRSDDDSVGLLGLPTIHGEDGKAFTANSTAGMTQGSDGYAIYTADRGRPHHARMVMPLRLSGDIRRGLTLVLVLAGCALFVAGLPFNIDKAAIGLITLPATFSATVLLVRERSTLSAKILRDYKWALVAAVFLLWLASLARVTGLLYDPATAPPSTTTVTTTVPVATQPATTAPSVTPTPSSSPKPRPVPPPTTVKPTPRKPAAPRPSATP